MLAPLQSASSAGNVLVIEDDPDARANLRDILELDNCAVETAGSMSEVLSRSSLADVGVIILDRRLPDGNALDFLPTLRAHAPAAAVVIVTAHSDLEGAIEALRLGAADYILKPYSAASLRLRIGRLLAQQRLALAKERSDSVFRNLVEAAECLIVMIRPDDHAILYYSHFAEQLTGYRADEAHGKSFLELAVPRPEQPGFIARCRAALKGKPQREIQSKLLCRDGSWRIVLRNIRCLPDYDGSPALLIVGNDITELKRAQEHALNSERMAAIGQMCAGLAHESRNALQRSQACLEMLALKLADRPDSLNLIGRIQQAQDDLHRLYEDVREYAAPIKLGVGCCDLAAIWRRAWHHLEPLHSARLATLHEVTGGLELSCEADPFRLEQVFRNILDNALAACTERPEITISATPVSLEEREAIRLAILDNGPGLSAEQRARMFQSFYTTKTRGTGLGLAIVKRIIEAHGGRVGLGETRRKGAEIILTLPRQQEG